MKRLTFVTGGERSGKSRYALSLASDRSGPRVFIATAELVDDEMRDRILKHKAERGNAFLTVEEPLDIANALASVAGNIHVAVIDCLTVWLGNLMHHRGEDDTGYPEVTRFLARIEDPPCDLIVVSNEVGMGIVPHNRLARQFRDISGRVNQAVARRADSVVFMVSGIPLVLKG